MKVVAFNGSPKKSGNTFHTIKIVTDELEKENITTEIINVGSKTIRGCIGCGVCAKNQDEKCSYSEDEVNDWIQIMKDADGIILGSPVYYSGINGTMKSFLDRAFFVAGVNGSMFRHKVGTAVAAVRRTGGMPTLHSMFHFLNYSEMMIPSSNYWNVLHGMKPGEVEQDDEGVQIARVLGKNMAYLMKLIEAGKGTVEAPEQEQKVYTHFIR